MAFNISGFRDAFPMGSPTGGEGTYLTSHSYVTNDTKTAVETANYFDRLLLGTTPRLKAGELIFVSFDAAGAGGCRTYAVTVVNAHVVLVPAATT